MAEEASIKINIEEGSAKTTLKNLRKEVEAVDGSVDKLNKDFKQGQEQSTKTTVSLKTQLRNLKDEMVQLDHNSPKFKEMALEAGAMEDKIKDVDAQVRILSSDTKGLDALVGAGQAIGGAFQASQGAMALFGSESEEVQKAIQNVIAVQGIMNGVMAVSNAIRKESVVGQKLLSLWNGIVTAGQWLLNTAMLANPIGIIIIAITALVAGYMVLRKTLTDTKEDFNTLTKVILFMLGPLGLAILLYKELTKEVDELEGVREKQAKNENKRQAQQLKNIDKLRKAEKKAHNDKLTAIDLEIARLEAEGKSSFALKLQRLKDIRDEEQAILDSNNDKLQSWIEHYQNLARIQGQSDEQFKESLKNQGIDLDSLLENVLKNQEKQKQAIFSANTEIIALEREHANKSNKVSEKSSDDKVKNKEKEAERLKIQEEKAFNAFLRTKEKAEKEFLDSQLSAEQREINAVDDKYSILIDRAINFGEDTAILEEAREQSLFDIRRKFDEQEEEAQQALRDKKAEELEAQKQERQEQADQLVASAQEVISIISDIQSIANSAELKRIKEKQKAGEKLSKAEIKRLVNDEKQKRALAVAEIAIQTAVGIAKAVSAGAGLLFPANIPAIISGVAAVMSGVASATKILSAPLPTFDSPSAGGGGGGLDNGGVENAPSINPNQSGSTLLNQEPTQVFVVESDITNTQSDVNVIVEEATI